MIERGFNSRAVLRFNFENVAKREAPIWGGEHLPEHFEPRGFLRNRRFHGMMLVSRFTELLVQLGQLGFPRGERGAGGFNRTP